MTATDVEVARWLTGVDGLGAVARATELLDAGNELITLPARIRQDPAVLALDDDHARVTAAVVSAAVARRAARARWSRADRSLFQREALEQASDPQVSAWRARRLAGRTVWDLGAGIGGDSLALAAAGARVTAVDNDEARLVLLAHNASVHGVEVTTLTGDALVITPPAGAWIHADPGRRAQGRRVRRLADHQPPIGALLAVHATAPGMGVVLSPAVDLSDPELPADAELEFVQVDDRLVESVVWLRAARAGDTTATATLLPEGRTWSRSGPRPPRREVGEIGEHLVTVVPAAVRARLHDDMGEVFDGRRVARDRALFTTDEPPPSSPWWRSRPVAAVLPARAKAVRAWLRTAEQRPVEVVLHGVGGDPQDWWRQLGRPPRGPRGWRVELLRRDHDTVTLITDASQG